MDIGVAVNRQNFSPNDIFPWHAQYYKIKCSMIEMDKIYTHRLEHYGQTLGLFGKHW